MINKNQLKFPPKLPEIHPLPALQFPLPPTFTPNPKIRNNHHHHHPQRPLPSPPVPLSPSPSPSPLPSPVEIDPSLLSDVDLSVPLRSTVLTKPKHLRSKKTKNTSLNNRLSKLSISTVSTRVRRKNRWDALDALEGRRKPPVPAFPHVPKKKKSLKLGNVFVKPATFARPPPNPFKPIPNKPTIQTKNLPNFINLSDDSDPEAFPWQSSSSSSSSSPLNSPIAGRPTNPLSDFILPPLPPPRPSSSLHIQSYLDVDLEEPVVLEATRHVLRSPPPTLPQPQPQTSPAQPLIVQQPAPTSPPLSNQTQKTLTRVKGPVQRPPKGKPPGDTLPPSISRTAITSPVIDISNPASATNGLRNQKEKDWTQYSKPSGSRHHPPSSRRHKPSTKLDTANPTGRDNFLHYKSFIELDMDDQDTHSKPW